MTSKVPRKHQENILRIIVPIYNEGSFLYANPQVLEHFRELSLLSDIEVVFALGGANDESFNILIDAFKNLESVTVVKKDLVSPSVHKSILLGLEASPKTTSTFEYALLNPVDVTINSHDVVKLCEFLRQNKPSYGVFKKSYSMTSLVLAIQAIYLNTWRLGILKKFVWTNGPFIKKELLKNILVDEKCPDFLDDLFLSNQLKVREGTPVIMPSKVLVSSRRYQRRGSLKQVLTNFLVLLGHSLGFEETALKKLYRRG